MPFEKTTDALSTGGGVSARAGELTAITPKTKAILAVEAFGNPCHMAEIASIAAKHEIPLIEDSCEGLGGA
ncbi:MAG TPA: DegT/DnrJ/EryC1/StrS family aminotransferase, partial [Solirubrobacterales bacterium]|nr:DegT/DnrJ/EryC1/StrS family aminotransferase [Solirubrobacterales bacterium]